MTAALDALIRPEYPRSSAYDPQWVVDGCMGPNPLWLLEDLSTDLDLRPGMRVLDLGCGKGLTSIFLAREFGVTVWAADLWIAPGENAERFQEAGVAKSVYPIHAEAHALPFAPGFFDAILSIDAYQYFGTNDLYIDTITSFLKPDGQLAIAVPSLTRELREIGEIPAHIKEHVGWEALCFHTTEWWRYQWAISEKVQVVAARSHPEGWRDWLIWSEVCRDYGASDFVRDDSAATVKMLEADQGEYLTFALVAARRC